MTTNAIHVLAGPIRGVNAELQDIFAAARRLEGVRSQPPRPLPHLAARQRDGPIRPESLARKDPRPGPPGAAAHEKPRFDWRSRGF